MNNYILKLGLSRFQHSLILLIFVSALLIFLDLGFFSLSFIFGSLLIFFSAKETQSILKIKGTMWCLFAFLIIALLSILLSEIELTLKHLKIYIQTIYWFLLAVIVYNSYPYINKKRLSKYILLATLLLLFLYVIGFRKGMSQNGVAFSVIILAPLGFFYLDRLWKKAGLALLLVFLMLLNGSRTGAIISLFQSGLILLLFVPSLAKHFKSVVIIIVLLVSLFNVEPVRKKLGDAVRPYNPELGFLLEDPETVMRNDKSWLTRKAQIQKAKQIFAEYPLLGIGYTNFVEFDIEIDQSKIGSDRGRLARRTIDNRSSHNAYVSVISETGILGFSTFILFLIAILVLFWKNSKILGNTFEGLVFVSFVGLLIYFYTVSSFMGTSSWIMYGLVAGAAYSVSRRVLTTNQ